ncbi:MAG: HEAT repeat domain-containing protein [bacterium]
MEKAKVQKNESAEAVMPEVLRMYEVSGQDPITEHSFDRYKKDKADNDKKIALLAMEDEKKQELSLVERIKKSLSGASVKIQINMVEMIQFVAEKERAGLIEAGLNSANLEVQKAATKMIRLASKEEVDSLREIVGQKIKQGLVQPDSEAQKTAAEMIDYAPLEQIADLIREGLNHPNLEVQELAAEKIAYAFEEEKALLIEDGLNSANFKVRKAVIEAIKYVSVPEMNSLEEMVGQKIKEGLASADPELQLVSAEMIEGVSETKRISLIKEGLAHPNMEVQKVAADKIWSAQEKEIVSLIKEALTHPNLEVQKMAIERIKSAPQAERLALIREGLAHSSAEVQKAAIEMVGYAPAVEIIPLIKEGLAHDNPEVQVAAAEMIGFAPARVAYLVKEGLAHHNLEVQTAAAKTIRSVPLAEMPPLIKECLVHPNIEVQKAAAETIKFGPKKELASLIKEALLNPNREVQKAVIRIIGQVFDFEKDELFNIAVEKGWGEYLIQPPLYERGGVSEEKFSRTKFAKSGSGTTLLGGELKGKTIIREIKPQAFMAWEKIYENWEVWQRAGFDYVPIEPIQSFSVNQEGLVRVYSGVLDLSLGGWNAITSRFNAELEDQRHGIEAVIEDQNIEHGHTHDFNYCLRFFRDANGQPDLNRVPRLYLIDFDQAVSFGKDFDDENS